VRGLKLDSVLVAYQEHPEFGTEEFEFEGCTIEQLVPFAEVTMHAAKLPIPTLACPTCTGRNVRSCTTCNGVGRVVASQVTSQEAASSPTLDKYR